MPRADSHYKKLFKLSPREIEVLQWTACGKTSEETAMLLGISVPTVNTHIRSACVKLEAVNKNHATAIALVHGGISMGSSSLTIPLPTLFGLLKLPREQSADVAGKKLRRVNTKVRAGDRNE